jgi:hypothetical protein
MIIAGGAVLVRQGIKTWETGENKFDAGEVVLAVVLAPVIAAAVTAEPLLLIVVAGLGVASGIDELAHGNYYTGGYDIVLSILPAVGGRRAYLDYRGGNRPPLRARMLEVRRLFGLDPIPPRPPANGSQARPQAVRVQLWGQLTRELADFENRDLRNMRHVERRKLLILELARRVQEGVQDMFRFENLQEFLGGAAVVNDGEAVVFDERWLSVDERLGLRMEVLAETLARYPRQAPKVAHELSHLLLRTNHGGPNDTSWAALRTWYLDADTPLISRATARLLLRSTYWTHTAVGRYVPWIPLLHRRDRRPRR